MNLNENVTLDKSALPAAINLSGLGGDAFVEYFLKNKADIDSQLQAHGALKFRGVEIGSIEKFEEIVNSISSRFLNYIDGNSPRTKLTGKVYTSTEYDPSQKITMHNELSYSAKWPNKLFFTCLDVAESGGETLLADSRKVLRAMNQDIVKEVSERGLIYIRNLNDGTGIGPSWQDTFESQDKNEVEAYCNQYGINFEWIEDSTLRLKQPGKGIIEHRTTGEKLWFNQMDQFHPSHMDEELYEAITSFYDTPEEFPIYVTFGDGGLIEEDMIKQIMTAIDQVTIFPAWQKNELLIVDNELVSHGRNSFTGSRKVLVAMSE